MEVVRRVLCFDIINLAIGIYYVINILQQVKAFLEAKMYKDKLTLLLPIRNLS